MRFLFCASSRRTRRTRRACCIAPASSACTGTPTTCTRTRPTALATVNAGRATKATRARTPAPKPFACVCVSNAAAFKAQDDLARMGVGMSPLVRWDAVPLRRSCCSCAALLQPAIGAVAASLTVRCSMRHRPRPSQPSTSSRRAFPYPALRQGASQRALRPPHSIGSPQLGEGRRQASTRGGPRALAVRVLDDVGLASLRCARAVLSYRNWDGWTQEYWVGCGFLIPDVIVARPEFGANPG